MAIRNQALTVNFYAYNYSTGAPVTGDSGNFTMRIIEDGGTPAAPANAVSEPDSTNMPGVYELALDAGEMDADFVTLHGQSSTANVAIVPLFMPTESGDLAVIDGNVDAILVDTADMQPKLGTPAGASISADLATIDTVVDGIQTDLDNGTDGLGAIKADTAAILVDTNELQSDDVPGLIAALDTVVDRIEADTQDIQARIPATLNDYAIPQKNTAFSNFTFLMVLASDNVTPATGLTVTGEVSLDGGAFAAVSGTIAEISNGIYQFDAAAGDTNGDSVIWRFTAATANDTFVTFKTVE